MRATMRWISNRQEENALQASLSHHRARDEEMAKVDRIEGAAENPQPLAAHERRISSVPTRTRSPGFAPARSSLRFAPTRTSARLKYA